jgi:hypothetical protein
MVEDDINPISEDEQRDTYFDGEKEDAIQDLYLMLYEYGYSHEQLAPIAVAIEHTTHHSAWATIRLAECSDDEEAFNSVNSQMESRNYDSIDAESYTK